MRWWESSWDYNPELYDRVSVISDRTVLELLFLSLLDFLDFSLICWCPSIWLLIWASYSITLFNELSPAQHMLVNCTNFVPICVIDLTLSLPIFLFINKTETQDPIIVLPWFISSGPTWVSCYPSRSISYLLIFTVCFVYRGWDYF